MTLVKKQALIRTITMSIVLILWWLAICFINNRLLFGIFCISMAVIAFIRMNISRHFITKSDKGTLTLPFIHSYLIGDEREQYLMLNAGYIAGQVIVIFVFVLTVVFDLVVAIAVGIVLAAVLFMSRMSDVAEVTKEESSDEKKEIFKLSGALFFGASDKIAELKTAEDTEKVILNMSNK